jgi:hypothetical protein
MSRARKGLRGAGRAGPARGAGQAGQAGRAGRAGRAGGSRGAGSSPAAPGPARVTRSCCASSRVGSRPSGVPVLVSGQLSALVVTAQGVSGYLQLYVFSSDFQGALICNTNATPEGLVSCSTSETSSGDPVLSRRGTRCSSRWRPAPPGPSTCPSRTRSRRCETAAALQGSGMRGRRRLARRRRQHWRRRSDAVVGVGLEVVLEGHGRGRGEGDRVRAGRHLR